jgi:hypothetical protein
VGDINVLIVSKEHFEYQRDQYKAIVKKRTKKLEAEQQTATANREVAKLKMGDGWFSDSPGHDASSTRPKSKHTKNKESIQQELWQLHDAEKILAGINLLFKTRLCNNFPQCSFGSSCTFAHGPSELQPRPVSGQGGCSMFVGGLAQSVTNQKCKEYFEKYGEVRLSRSP